MGVDTLTQQFTDATPRHRRIVLLDDGGLAVDENFGGSHTQRSRIEMSFDGHGFKVGCTRVDIGAMGKIVEFAKRHL